MRPFGVFVSLPGVTRHGLVPANAVSEDMRFGRDDSDEAKVQALEWACPPHSDVWVKLIAVGEDEQRGGLKLTCAVNVVDQATGADLDPGNTRAALGRPPGGPPQSEEPPPVGSVHRAVVQDIKPYGIFVSLPGFRRSGLVHSSQVRDVWGRACIPAPSCMHDVSSRLPSSIRPSVQVSEHLRFTKDDSDEEKVASLAGVVAVGDSVWVKVVEVEGAEQAGGRVKVGCSMKHVNQGSGVDLDPNNTHYRPRGAPRDGGGEEFGGPGGEAAVVRAGVVQWGHHLAAVKSLDGRTYELLKEEEPQAGPPSRVETKEAMLRSVGGGGVRGGGDFLSEPATAAETAVHIGSVEEAQRILARYQRKAEKREAKKARRERKAEKKSKKSHKRRSRSKDSSSTSS